MSKIFVILLAMSLIACEKKFEVATASVSPASSIDWLGENTKLVGDGSLKVGQPLPAIRLINSHMKISGLVSTGHVQLISVLPSLDTEVCDLQTRELSQNKKLLSGVQRITISRDLPYAQGRFGESAKIANLEFFSDYRYGDLGRLLGLEIARNSLLARALIVTDAKGVVRYFQIVPKIYSLPDLDKAIAVANQLVGS